MSVMLMQIQIVQSHRHCIPSESSGHKHAVQCKADFASGCSACVQLSLESESLDIDHREDCVLTVGINDMRMPCHRNPAEHYFRNCCFGRVFRFGGFFSPGPEYICV